MIVVITCALLYLCCWLWLCSCRFGLLWMYLLCCDLVWGWCFCDNFGVGCVVICCGLCGCLSVLCLFCIALLVDFWLALVCCFRLMVYVALLCFWGRWYVLFVAFSKCFGFRWFVEGWLLGVLDFGFIILGLLWFRLIMDRIALEICVVGTMCLVWIDC